MKIGFGVSHEKEAHEAFQEAYRKSLQKIGATKADFCMVFYSYDFGLDPASLSSALKRVFRDTAHVGCSTWSAWFQREGFESDSGVVILSFKDLEVPDVYRVHSLKEKAELWSAELGRTLTDRQAISSDRKDLIMVMADSLNFTPGNGFVHLERQFPQLQVCGFGASYSVPQVSLVLNGDVFYNSLLAIHWKQVGSWIGLAQNVQAELKTIEINRMSENLLIEIDQKPAFYKLCEHLMTSDDLPMMSPDSFRKHMGDLYIVEVPRVQPHRPRCVGDVFGVVSLLGSEMTTGMVAVAQDLDFSLEHFLGQKKVKYAEQNTKSVLEAIHASVSDPQLIMMFTSVVRLRDKDRTADDLSLLRTVYPHAPVLSVASHGEYLGGPNQFSALFVIFPKTL